jgi:glycine/D-amino acid oxidase-like deaminating enzyme
MEDTPNFTYDPATSPCRAGIRPHREVTYRLELDTHMIPGKLIIHNYGHGGAGITMSWGCAEVACEMLLQHGTPNAVAVLGAGVMGLTAATLLVERNIPVTVYAEKFTPCTTSDVAGGQWAPSFVNYEKNDSAKTQAYFDVLRRARKAHERRGPGYGVWQRWNYTINEIQHLKELPPDIVPPATVLAHLPFARLNRPGFKYDLLLVEPPILMRRLQHDLAARVTFIMKKFQHVNDVATLSEKVIVNCTGYGAGKLFQDNLMKPLKGQVVFLMPPQQNLKYLFSGTGNCYVFPRSDTVIVGGSQKAVDDDTPDPRVCKDIIDFAKNVFDGTEIVAAELPDWAIGNK